MTKATSRRRSGTSQRVARPEAAKPSVERPNDRPSPEGPAGERGIALALLKYFYWIELGVRSYLRSRDYLEFSRPEGMVIASIQLGYSRPSDIARQLGVSRQAIHATIQQMKTKGIVDLVPDPDDRRIKQVVLTDLARRMNDDGIVAMNLLWNELGKRLGRVELNRLAKVLRADWGPPVLFDSEEQGPEFWRR